MSTTYLHQSQDGQPAVNVDLQTCTVRHIILIWHPVDSFEKNLLEQSIATEDELKTAIEEGLRRGQPDTFYLPTIEKTFDKLCIDNDGDYAGK